MGDIFFSFYNKQQILVQYYILYTFISRPCKIYFSSVLFKELKEECVCVREKERERGLLVVSNNFRGREIPVRLG